VPIIKQEINDIDYIQPQFYNNGYISGVPGSAEFIVSNYLGWMNKLSSYQIPDFEGVPANKLIMGLLASPSAGRSEFYAPAAEIEKAVNELDKMNINIGGIMFWDSHWDEQNSYTVGKASAKALGLE
jgi:chitinase